MIEEFSSKRFDSRGSRVTKLPRPLLVDDIYDKKSLVDEYIFPVNNGKRGTRVTSLDRNPRWTVDDHDIYENIKYFRVRANIVTDPKAKERLNAVADLLEDSVVVYHLKKSDNNTKSSKEKDFNDVWCGIEIIETAYDSRINDLRKAIDFLLEQEERTLKETGYDMIGSSFLAVISRSPRSTRKTLLEVLETYYEDHFQNGDLVALKILSSEMTTREDDYRCLKW